MAKLGGKRVAILIKDAKNKPIERLADIEGIIHIPFEEHIDETRIKLARRLRETGLDIKAADLKTDLRVYAARWKYTPTAPVWATHTHRAGHGLAGISTSVTAPLPSRSLETPMSRLRRTGAGRAADQHRVVSFGTERQPRNRAGNPSARTCRATLRTEAGSCVMRRITLYLIA